MMDELDDKDYAVAEVPQTQISLDPKRLLFGDGVQLPSGGKDLLNQGIVHVIQNTIGPKDPRKKADAINQALTIRENLDKVPDFSAKEGLNALNSFKSNWQQTGVMPSVVDVPAMESPSLRTPQVPRMPAPATISPEDVEGQMPTPPPWVSLDDRRKPLLDVINRFPPKPSITREDVTPTQQAFLIGAMIGDLFKSKGKNVGKIVNAFSSNLEKKANEKWAQQVKEQEMAARVAEMQLGFIDKEEVWQNQLARESYLKRVSELEDAKQAKLGSLSREEEKQYSEIRDASGAISKPRKLEIQKQLVNTLKGRVAMLRSQGKTTAAIMLDLKRMEVEGFDVMQGTDVKYETGLFQLEQMLPAKLEAIRTTTQATKERLENMNARFLLDVVKFEDSRQRWAESMQFKRDELAALTAYRYTYMWQNANQFNQMMGYRDKAQQADFIRGLTSNAQVTFEAANKLLDTELAIKASAEKENELEFLKAQAPEDYARLTQRMAKWAIETNAKRKEDEEEELSKMERADWLRAQPEFAKGAALKLEAIKKADAEIAKYKKQAEEAAVVIRVFSRKYQEYVGSVIPGEGETSAPNNWPGAYGPIGDGSTTPLPVDPRMVPGGIPGGNPGKAEVEKNYNEDEVKATLEKLHKLYAKALAEWDLKTMIAISKVIASLLPGGVK